MTGDPPPSTWELCPQCSKTFPRVRPHQRFCSTRCRSASSNERRRQPMPELAGEATLLEVLTEAANLFHARSIVTNAEVRAKFTRLTYSAQAHANRLKGRP
jgi:predicted nucleic acid-binding Zn ribbon protein